MQTNLYPLCFAPIYRDYLWGGERIAQRYGRTDAPSVCAESWELSDRADGMSVVINGPLAGTTLGVLVRERRADLLGAAVSSGPFPLLIKILDARQALSIQVHPNNATAREFGGEPKTEMWYVLDAEPQSSVYAGLQPGVTPATFRAALTHHTLEQQLRRVAVSPGDTLFIPGGRVHALGAGPLILEVQQNSNTTYRVYDWERVGPDGKLRDLHLEQAMQVINWHDAEPPKCTPRPLPGPGPNRRQELVRCAYFSMEQWDVVAPETLHNADDGCTILFVISGAVQLDGGSQSMHLAAGMTCLVPAACRHATLIPLRGPASVARIQPQIS